MKLIVIGEACKEVFIYGESKRLSPEAPVPVLNPIEVVSNFGMSGNVVENLKTLDENLEIIHWHQSELITKTRYVEKKSNHMFLRVDEGEEKIKPFELNISKTNAIKNVDGVIISDYNKGFLTEEVLMEITENAKFSIIDTKKKINEFLVEKFSFIKLNESEFSKHNFTGDKLDNILITLGSKGAKHKDIIYPSPDPKETIDVSGAGDTFTASFTLKYLQTKDVEQSIIFANKMASIVVSKRGFIGQNLKIELIKQGFDVIEINEDIFSSTGWKTELLLFLIRNKPKVIFHVGACSDTLEKDVNYMMVLNFEFTKMLVDWSLQNDSKLIYSSSAASYGENNLHPSNLYGWSKYVAEQYVITNNGIGLRYFNIFGPRQNPNNPYAAVIPVSHSSINYFDFITRY